MIVEVYINNERLDLFDTESISVTQSTQDINDISKVFVDYSQQFTIPATKRNNQILKNWYNADVDNGFDARVRVPAFITVNTLDFKRGKIRLDSAKIENNNPTSYKLTFFGDVIKIKDLLKEDRLSDLEWLANFNHDYNDDKIKEGLTLGLDFTVNNTTYNEAVIYPMISYKRQWFYNTDPSDNTNSDIAVNIAANNTTNKGIIAKDLKPAIKLHLIVKAIQEQYGFKFNSPFFDSFNFKKIYVNLNNKTESIGVGLGSEVVEEVSGNYVGDSDLYFERYRYRVTVVPSAGFQNTPYKIRLTINDELRYESQTFITGSNTKTGISLYELNYNTKCEIITESEFNYSVFTTFEYRAFDIGIFGDEFIDTVYTNTYNNQSINITTNIPSLMPDIKVLDFLTGIFKTFNLVAVADGEDILIQDLPSWYKAGKIYDVTKWVDLESETIKRGKVYKELNFKFEKSEQLISDNFRQSNNKGYGDLELDVSEVQNLENIDGQKLEVKSVFENPVFDRLINVEDNEQTNIQYCPYISRDRNSISGNIFMFYAEKNFLLSNPINFINDGARQVISGNVFMPSHSRSIDNPSFNLNFNAEINEYTYQPMDNTIYDEYWSDYIGDMFSPKRRIFDFKSILPDFLLNQLKLNDRLVIKDRRYIINKITSNLTNRNDKLELINDIYEVPLVTDVLTTSSLTPESNVYPSVESDYNLSYTGLNNISIRAVDFGSGTNFLSILTAKTTGEVSNIDFRLDTNNTGVSRSVGIQVNDGINNPISIIIQEAKEVITADNNVITADNNIITVDNG